VVVLILDGCSDWGSNGGGDHDDDNDDNGDDDDDLEDVLKKNFCAKRLVLPICISLTVWVLDCSYWSFPGQYLQC